MRLVICFALVAGLINLSNGQRTLPKYYVDRTKISTSGASSGAAMATQLHVAYSSLIMGAGLIAGNPYYCAQGDALQATGACVSEPDRIPIADIISDTNAYASSGDIDATMNMFNDRIFVFAGTLDSTVNPGIGPKVVEFYQNYVDSVNIRTEFTIPAEHCYPTMDYGESCDTSGSPWINDCDYDGAYEILNHFYGGLTRPTGLVNLTGDFYLFDQSEFFGLETAHGVSMDTAGFVYVPSGCMYNQNLCMLHVMFHGCAQGRYRLDDLVARNTGYNEVGELNNIIILYPQAISIAVNPMGCWDWWGYTTNRYATNKGDQLDPVRQMIDRIS